MKHHTMKYACCAIVLSLLSACMGSRGTAQNTYIGGEGKETEQIFGDPQLAKQFVMEDIKTQRRNDRLFVQFNLRNTKSSNLAIEWTINWFDAGGFLIETANRWQPASMGGKGYQTITQTAPTPEATEFRLGVRKPNTVH